MVKFQWPLRRTKKGEVFVARKAMNRLETEGFKPLIKTDVLEKRLAKMEKTLNKVSTQLITAVTPETMLTAVENAGKAIDEAHNLVFYISSAWLRSMENRWLAEKINQYIEQYSELRPMCPEFFDTLLAETKSIINLAYTNIDVEPLRPIIIQTISKGGYYPPWQENIGPPRGYPPMPTEKELTEEETESDSSES